METREELIFAKILKATNLNHGIDIPTATLPEFGIPQGEHHVVVTVNDEAGVNRSFRLATRRQGHPKPIIASTDWFNFVRLNNLQEGDTIAFYKTRSQANGPFDGYQVKLDVAGAIRVFGAVIGRE